MDKKILDQIVELILNYKRPERIVIFGSRASGNFNDRSDIDIAVLGRHWTDKDINIVKHMLDEFVKTPLKFDLLNFYRIGKTKLKEDILKKGRVVYDSGEN